MQHVLIIGAGLIGACLALRLTRAGPRVTVIETAQPATGATGASFGWINASFFHSPAHFNLRAAGIAAHHRLDGDLSDTGTRWQGRLWWEEDGAALDARTETLTAPAASCAPLPSHCASSTSSPARRRTCAATMTAA